MSIEMTFAVAVCVVLFYLVVVNRLNAVLRPLRLDLADVGSALVSDTSLNDKRKAHIEKSMDMAYSTPLAWLFVVLMPIATLSAIRDVVLGRADDGLPDVPSDLKPDVRHFCGLWFLSVIGNSPLAALLVVIQLALVALLWLPMGHVMRELMLAAQAATERMESASASVSHNLEHWNASAH